jgi:hypothetical protein
MNAQTDLFGEPADTASSTAITKPGSPLAMPCGYLDRSNKRCRKLAHRPVMMNGIQMHSHGRPMLHCEMECFTGTQTEVDERSTPT